MAPPQEKIYTLEDIFALPEGQRAELIDGQMYMMAPPNTNHQRISYASTMSSLTSPLSATKTNWMNEAVMERLTGLLKSLLLPTRRMITGLSFSNTVLRASVSIGL